MSIIYKALVSVSVVLLISLQGCLAHAEQPGASARYLFADDFDEDELGAAPAKWKVYADSGYVSVVSDAITGRAMRMMSDPGRQNTSASATLSGPLAAEAKILVVEHRVYSSQEKNNMYVSKDGSHRLHWWVSAGHLYFNRGVGNQRSSVKLGPLQEGWNHLRLVADIETQTVVFYLNDKALGEAMRFGREIDSWADAELIFSQSRSVEGEFRYADVQVWTPTADEEASLREMAEQADPIWIEYDDVARKSQEWWQSQEALFLAERIVHRMDLDDVFIDVPIGSLTVTDGILPTQLSILAHMYAQSGAPKYQKAFSKGLGLLLEAQYQSGGWPTVYPRYKNRDLHLDMYAKATWSAIPSLLNGILTQQPPFDTDIASEFDSSALESALSRIPPKESIKRFSYADYASRSPEWWESEEAVFIGDNLLSWQLPHGGWFRDEAWAVLPFSPESMTRTGAAPGQIERGRPGRNGTINPMRFLARLYEVTGEERFLDGFYRGLDYLLVAQYPSGGWPNDYPDPTGNGVYVTFNDGAMADLVHFIQDMLQGKPPFGFVTEVYKERLQEAYTKAIDFILKAQIVVDGRPTAWGQQHDPVSYEPRPYRVFEPAAISGAESVGIISLLQSIDDHRPEVLQAILFALEWLEEVRLPDGRWARFYEIGTNRPIFVGRDGIIRYDISEIDLERQLGYGWYGTWGESLLTQARNSGYLDRLYERLPEHPTVRVRFHDPREGAKVAGVVPMRVSLLHPAHEALLTKVTIGIDGTTLYEGTGLPPQDEWELDTRPLSEGSHTFLVELTHGNWGSFSQTLNVVVNNRWNLVQNMHPPTTSNWFGFSETFDFLDATDRSEGWAYETDEPELFFGDRDRLVKVTDSSEYLVWETPHLKDVTMELYTQPKVAVEEGLVLEVSDQGNQWQRLPFLTLSEDTGSNWNRLVIQLSAEEDESVWNYFRLTLTESLTKDRIQIGRVVISGYNY